jgi:ferric-dicitrate binding protein FerR (iron transport regulator)
LRVKLAGNFMNTSDLSDSPHADEPADKQDDKLAQLLASVEPRKAPPAHIEAQVRAAVHAEWLHLTQRRKAKQQHRWLAAAAVLVCAISVGWWVRNTIDTKGQVTVASSAAATTVAVIAQLHGAAALNDVIAAPTNQIHSSDVLRTHENAGMRIELQNGASLRVAANTELHWLAVDSVQLVQGAVYVDSHANAAPFTIHTPHGDVTHLGTRYLVDVEQQLLRVAVREGEVAIHPARNQLSDRMSDQVSVGALQQVQMEANGEIVRNDLQLGDVVWQWADALAQPFTMENRSVAEFLQWVASETGCELNYSSATVKNAASNTVLHGQSGTQAPLQAMQVVLATTDFHASVQGRQLVITQR